MFITNITYIYSFIVKYIYIDCCSYLFKWFLTVIHLSLWFEIEILLKYDLWKKYFPFFTVFSGVCGIIIIFFIIVAYYVDSGLTAALSLALLWALLCHVYPPAATFLDIYWFTIHLFMVLIWNHISKHFVLTGQ